MDQKPTMQNKLDDPKDKFYLKFCFVCSEEAKAGKEHLKNYGGIVCFSCRGFWRRSHQTTKNPILHCKRSNNCELTPESRRHCKKCRYQKCLLAGMRSEAVFDLEQKKAHFKKYYSKQEKLSRSRKKKSQRRGAAASSRRKAQPKISPQQEQKVVPQPKFVEIPLRTPERMNLSVSEGGFPVNLEAKEGSLYCPGHDMERFEPYPASFSNFLPTCSNDINYEVASSSLNSNNQAGFQLQDLDTINNDALFYWNYMDFAN